jgi:hypothetical protein
MPEKKEPTDAQVLSAVSLSAEPTPGADIRVTRAGKIKTIPIQYLLNRLRAAYPNAKFTFGDLRQGPASPDNQEPTTKN